MKLYETTKYSCDKCDKSYTAKGNLNQHIKTHDIPEVATCSKCKKVFATITSYKIHMKNVHSESKEDIAQVTHFSIMYRTFADITAQNNCTEPEELKCNFCLKSFSNKGNLKRHKEKIHEVEKETDTSKKVTCHICQNKFTQVYNMNQHIKKVHGIQFSCKKCSADFLTDGNLNKHILRVHNETKVGTKRKLCDDDSISDRHKRRRVDEIVSKINEASDTIKKKALL